VFTNQQDNVPMEAVGNQILDAYLGAPKRDWIALGAAYRDKQADEAKTIEAAASKVAASAGPPPLPLSAYVGRFTDAWRGDASVRLDGNTLILKFSRTQKLEGVLTPYGGNIFIVRWNNSGLGADAYVRFAQGFDGGVEGMTMRAVSPATDFSFDFQDLDFKIAETTTGR
jgi:hypothetical protein